MAKRKGTKVSSLHRKQTKSGAARVKKAYGKWTPKGPSFPKRDTSIKNAERKQRRKGRAKR